MNMSKPDEGSANITPDEWERIARYLTGEAGHGEADATRRWIEDDTHRANAVRRLESILANASREDSSPIDVESALKRVKSRLDEPRVIALAPRATGAAPDRTFAALLRVAAAAIIIFGGLFVWQKTRASADLAAGQTFATSVGERRQVTLKDGTRIFLGPTSRLVESVMASMSVRPDTSATTYRAVSPICVFTAATARRTATWRCARRSSRRASS